MGASVTAATLGLAAAYLAFAAGLYLTVLGLRGAIAQSRSVPAAGPRSGAGSRAGSGTVTCPRCGLENGAGYAYCRDCTAALSTPA